MRLRSGDKHHPRKSAHRKAQNRKAICRFSRVVFIPQAQPHAQSLFLFPIVFGINFNLDTPSSTYFPLFKLALRPGTRTTPYSSRHVSLISPPRNQVAFSFAKTSDLNPQCGALALLLLQKAKKNIQTNDRQMTIQKVSPQFVVDQSSAAVCPDRSRGQLQRCSAATSLATSSADTILLPSQMSQIAGYEHQRRRSNSSRRGQ